MGKSAPPIFHGPNALYAARLLSGCGPEVVQNSACWEIGTSIRS
jgi:hypothetical protein